MTTLSAMMDESFTGLVPLCRLEELPVGLGRAFEVAGRTIAVFRTRQGEVFAVDNHCPHKGGPLAEGMIARDANDAPQVVCPLHAFRFEAASGACDQSGTCPVETFPVVEKEGSVFVRLPSGS